MALITINSLGVILSDPLFENLSFAICKGDRIGLVAANGVGKSTLFDCLVGNIDPTTGEITRARGLRIGHVVQNLPPEALGFSFYDWVLAALPSEKADYESWRVDVALDELAVPLDLHRKSLAELSGGWQRTALLAAAWVQEPDVLLLDEPTNHLDLRRIVLLQDWLGGLPHETPVMVISHDRAFLDATTNRTLFLRPENSRMFPLPYSKARSVLDEADIADERRFANDMSKAKQLRKQAAKLKNIGVNSGSDLLVNKTKQLRERAEKIEAHAKPAHQERGAGDIKLINSGTHAKALITLPEIEVKAPDGRILYRTDALWINKGDRIVLLGSNGTGKTRLMKRIHQALLGEEGPIKCTPSTVLGYSDQNLSQLDPEETPMEAVTGAFDIGDQRARALLAGAGMRFQMQDTKIGALSGGQKSRLAMLVLRLQAPNFYLLDEPTNHLDIDGQEALEIELKCHGATCLVVSHDRSFLRAVGKRFWLIQGKKLVEVDSPEGFLAEETRR